jgi:NADH-quinone oxidoreductase subunit C
MSEQEPTNPTDSASKLSQPKWIEKLTEQMPDSVEESGFQFDPYVFVKREKIVDVLRFLRDEPELSFQALTNQTAVDYLDTGRVPRFEVVYHLWNLERSEWAWLRVRVPEEDCWVASATAVYRSADWQEREIWDLYGIQFRGHPNLKKILTPDHLAGHPLRKDYDVQEVPVDFHWTPLDTYGA